GPEFGRDTGRGAGTGRPAAPLAICVDGDDSAARGRRHAGRTDGVNFEVTSNNLQVTSSAYAELRRHSPAPDARPRAMAHARRVAGDCAWRAHRGGDCGRRPHRLALDEWRARRADGVDRGCPGARRGHARVVPDPAAPRT